MIALVFVAALSTGSVAVLPRAHRLCAGVSAKIQVPIRVVSRSGAPLPGLVRALYWSFEDGRERFGHVGERFEIGKDGWAFVDRIEKRPDGTTVSLFIELMSSPEGDVVPSAPAFIVGMPACVLVVLD